MDRINQLDELPNNIKVYLYGAGSGGALFYAKLKKFRKDIQVLGFIDDSDKLTHCKLDVYKVEDIKNKNYDYIIISSIYDSIISKKLEDFDIKNYIRINHNLINTFDVNTYDNFITQSDTLYSDIYKEIEKLFLSLNINNIEPEDIIQQIESFNIGWDLSNKLNNVNLNKIFEKKLQKKINTIAIYPCAIYVENAIKTFKNYFEEILLFDDFKGNVKIGNLDVQHSDNLEKYDNKIDAYFISTRIPELKDFFLEEKIPDNSKAIWINDIVLDIYSQITNTFEEVDEILYKINNSKKPLIILGGKYYNNYTPTFEELEKKGYDIFLISRVPEVSHTSPNPSYHLLPFENKYILDINQMLYFSKNLTKGEVIIHSEGFLNPQFEGFKTLCSYVYPLIILKQLKVKKFFFLYDLIKPFYHNFKYENELIKIYKELLYTSDGIILNSNTKEGVEFLKNSLQIQSPIISYLRYNFAIKQKQEKLKNGFHIVMVGGFLDDVGDEMRTISKEAKKILSQGIHLHYYANTSGIPTFIDSLDEYQKKYFHPETPIMNQNELLYEISKYHAGWMVHNTQKIADIISKANNQFLKDNLFMFLLTTVPSAILLFGSAGLPMFINRSMTGILDEFPKENFIPIELAEINAIKNIINDINWNDKFQKTEKNKHLFSTEYNINRLIDFFKKVN